MDVQNINISIITANAWINALMAGATLMGKDVFHACQRSLTISVKYDG